MLALLGAVALLAPVDVVLLPSGDALLLACHDTAHGWFTGRACLRAALGAEVRTTTGKPFKLAAAATPTKCGGTEGFLALGKAPAGHKPIFSARRKPRACRERKPYHLAPAVAAAVQAALVADMKANPSDYEKYDGRPLPPIASGFSMNAAVEIDIEGKGKTEQIISVTDMGRKLTAVLRLDGEKATVLRVNAYGPLQMNGGDCGDFDGDGVAEVILAEGGETERVYYLTRFVRGEADVIAAMGCGD